MKHATERSVLSAALQRRTQTETVLATLYVALPRSDGKQSNGKVHFCITRSGRYRQLVAELQRANAHWTFSYPEPVVGALILPEPVVRYIRRQLRSIGVPHVRGIRADTMHVRDELPFTGLLN